MKYTFDLNVTLATLVTVEADSYEEALEKVEKAAETAPFDYNEWDKVGSDILDSENEEE